MSTYRKRKTIFTKLVIVLLLTILPTYILNLILNQEITDRLRENIVESMHTNVHFYLNFFEDEIENIDSIKQSFASDPDLDMLSVVAPALSEVQKREMIMNLQHKLRQMTDSTSYIQEIRIHIPLIGKVIIPDSYIEGDRIEDLKKLREIKKTTESPLTFWNNEMEIDYVYPEYGKRERVPVYAIEIILNKEEIQKKLKSLTDHGGAFLYFGKQNVYLENGSAEYKQAVDNDIISKLRQGESRNSMSFEHAHQKYLISYEQSARYGLTLAMYTPEADLLGEVTFYRYLLVALFCGSIALVIVFSSWIYRKIRIPIHTLRRAFREMQRGNLTVKIHYSSQDEFEDIANQFNYTVDRINTLYEEVYQQKIRMQHAELKQLQSQINPHFLYNSFFILHQLIEFEDAENAKLFVKHLGNYFQFITRDRNDEIELGDELKHARAYAEIQMMRFGRRILVEFDALPEKLQSVIVPRLIIQPIIENAYQHGLESKTKQGKLHVQIFADETWLRITIADNGEQLSEEGWKRMQALLASQESEKESYGILNVHQRLQMKFGSDSGLELSRNIPHGLCVTIKIPLLPRG